MSYNFNSDTPIYLQIIELIKSKIIINLDFNELDISEYRIDNDAIIINCFKERIKIKSKLFNGIVVNNYKIELSKEMKDKFKKANLFNEYNNFILYASIIVISNEYAFSLLVAILVS